MILEADVSKAQADNPRSFNLQVMPFSIAVLRDENTEHVLITEGLRQLRLELQGATVLEGPVSLRFRIPALSHIPPKVLSLRRLFALWRSQRLPPRLFVADPVVKRRIRALRALDARHAGASQRDMVIAFFGKRMADEQSFDSSRKKIVRLLKLAERRLEVARQRFFCEGDGYWED